MITKLHPIVKNLYETIAFADTHFFALIDLKVVALAQAQIDIDNLDPQERDILYRNFERTLIDLKNCSLIYNYELVENGFKVIPDNKIYINESPLYILFNKDYKDIIA